MRVKTQRLGLKARFKVKGGFLLATVFLTLIDFFYWWLPRVIPLRRRQRPAGRLVFRVRE